jgi:hypothetical protein
MDLLPKMPKFSRYCDVTPNAKSGFAGAIAEYVIFADNRALRIDPKAEIRLGKLLKDAHLNQQAARRNSLHFNKVARGDGDRSVN